MLKKRNTEIEHPQITEIEHQVDHPDVAEDNLRNATFAPGENAYLNEGQIPYS